MARKFKFYLLGLIPGMIVVFLVLNAKGTSCSYFPNDRVLAETLTKKFIYSSSFSENMKMNRLDETFLRDSILTKGKIDFDKSHAQKNPCPDYYLLYPSKNPQWKIIFEKCKETANFNSLEKY